MSLKKLSEKRSGHSSSRFKMRRSSRSLEKKLNSITEIDDVSGEVICSTIMEEILQKALEIIHERYMENQLIKFVVHCSHQALMKMLRIHFYQHNDYVRNSDRWGPEKIVEPSSPDSWALHRVPLSKNISAEPELNTLSLIKVEMARKGEDIVVENDLDVISQPSETLLEDIRMIIDEIVDNLPLDADLEKSEKSPSVISAFTMVVEGLQHYNTYKMKPQLSKISLGESTTFKLPKIDLPESGASRRYQSVTELASVEEDRLPPIRTDANYKCRPMSFQDDKLKKLKKRKEQKSP